MPADLHSSLSDLKRARIHSGIPALQDVFVYAPVPVRPLYHDPDTRRWCIRKQLHQRMLCHAAKRHIAVLFPILLVEGKKRKHINRRFKYIHCIALPNPMKTVPRITAVHVSFERITGGIRSAFMRMTWNSLRIISHKYRIVIFGILINHLRLCKLCHNSTIQTSCSDQVSEHPVHIGMRFRQYKQLFWFRFLWFALPIGLSLFSAKQHRDCLRKALIIICPDKVNRKSAFFCFMVIPSISAYGDAVITGKPFFSAGF